MARRAGGGARLLRPRARNANRGERRSGATGRPKPKRLAAREIERAPSAHFFSLAIFSAFASSYHQVIGNPVVNFGRSVWSIRSQ